MRGRHGIVLVWIGLMAGCTIDGPSQDTLTCQGEAMYPGAACKDGVWVRSDVPTLQDMRQEMGPPPDMGSDLADMPAPLDLGDMRVDPIDMPEDMPIDMPDCSPTAIEALCGGAVACGTTPALLARCPDATCPRTCEAVEQCIDNQCVGCVMRADIDAQSSAEKICEAAFEDAGASPMDLSISCGMGAVPVVDFCGVETSSVSCMDVCPGGMQCESGLCCVEDDGLVGLCDTLSERDLCMANAPGAGAMVNSCTQGITSLKDVCGRTCPFSITDGGRLGSPSSGSGTLILQHERVPSDNTNLARSNIIYWLRPEDRYFSPASGSWTAVTGINPTDEDTASLFYASDTPLNVANSSDLLRGDASMNPTHLNFNPYVDFGGGYVEFNRPSSFKDDVSAIFVVRNGPGSEVLMNGSGEWFERPPILSGEWGEGGLDYGLTLNGGRLEWSRDGNDQPALTSPSPLDDSWHVVAIRRDKNAMTKMYIDGVEVASGTVPNESYESMIARLGRHPAPQNDTGRWQGDLAEVLLYNTLVSIDVLQRLNTYLAIKYGLTQSFDYKDRVTTFYDVSSHEQDIFGIACNALTMPLRQSTSRSKDGLWELRAGTVYSGVSSCPTSPSRFSALMGHDGGALDEASMDSVRWEARDIDVSVLEREWKLMMTLAPDASNMASMTFSLKQNTFALDGGEMFVPEFVVVSQGSDAWLFPLQPIPGGAVLSVVDFSRFEPDGLDFRAPIYLKLGRFSE